MTIEVRTRVDDTRQHTVLEVRKDGKLFFRHLLDAADLDAHIRNLAKCRAQMADEVPSGVDPGSRFVTLIDPTWFIDLPENDPPEGRAMLVRHPGFGWLAFVFPYKKAAAIAEWLAKCVGGDSNP